MCHTDSRKNWCSPTDPVPALDELEVLHRSLNTEQRDELLECLLIAASKGADAMMQALLPWLLAAATRDLLEGTDCHTGSA